jgi:hypothetical protein
MKSTAHDMLDVLLNKVKTRVVETLKEEKHCLHTATAIGGVCVQNTGGVHNVISELHQPDTGRLPFAIH